MFKPAVENTEKTNSSSASHAGDGIYSAAREAWTPRPQSSEGNISQIPSTPSKSLDLSIPIASGYPASDATNSNYQNATGSSGSDMQSTASTGTDSRLQGTQSNGGFDQRQNYSGKMPGSDGSQPRQQQNAMGNPGSDIQSTAMTGTDSRLEGMQSNGGLDQRTQSNDSFDQRQNYSGKQSGSDVSQPKQQPVPGQMYQIKAGDNLWNIASRGQSGDANAQSNADTAKFSSQIVDANNLSHPNLIKPGEQIKIPARS